MSGPRVPHMIKKQNQMDDVVKMIFEAIENRVQHKDTLLVLLGDHGMSGQFVPSCLPSCR
jgi:ethanolaminephosphotransferase